MCLVRLKLEASVATNLCFIFVISLGQTLATMLPFVCLLHLTSATIRTHAPLLAL